MLLYGYFGLFASNNFSCERTKVSVVFFTFLKKRFRLFGVLGQNLVNLHVYKGSNFLDEISKTEIISHLAFSKETATNST